MNEVFYIVWQSCMYTTWNVMCTGYKKMIKVVRTFMKDSVLNFKIMYYKVIV